MRLRFGGILGVDIVRGPPFPGNVIPANRMRLRVTRSTSRELTRQQGVHDASSLLFFLLQAAGHS
jgi:hypothetical protein